MSKSSVSLKIELQLKDAEAIDIVNSLPKEKRDEIIEKYIIIGDMVVSYASVSASRETVESLFAPLHEDIEQIREQLNRIIPAVATPAKKGKITAESIFKELQNHFLDDSFEDVSAIGKYADIKAVVKSSGIPILIESKDYSDTVKTSEVDKFWRDLETRNLRYGVFVSLRTAISKMSCPVQVETKMDRTAIFVNNSEFSSSGHIFAYYIARKITELEKYRKIELKGGDLTKTVSRVNQHLEQIKKDLQTIDKIQEIADSLLTTSKTKLDALISLAKTYKQKVLGDLDSAFEDLKKVEVCE